MNDEDRQARAVAHRRVASAVRHGRLPLASALRCVDCGEQAHDWDHHLGYETEFVFAVVPRCQSCHHTRHQNVLHMLPDGCDEGRYTEHINFGLTPDLRLRIQKIARRSGEKEGATVRRLVREAVEREEAHQKEGVA